MEKPSIVAIDNINNYYNVGYLLNYLLEAVLSILHILNLTFIILCGDTAVHPSLQIERWNQSYLHKVYKKQSDDDIHVYAVSRLYF